MQVLSAAREEMRQCDSRCDGAAKATGGAGGVDGSAGATDSDVGPLRGRTIGGAGGTLSAEDQADSRAAMTGEVGEKEGKRGVADAAETRRGRKGDRASGRLVRRRGRWDGMLGR